MFRFKLQKILDLAKVRESTKRVKLGKLNEKMIYLETTKLHKQDTLRSMMDSGSSPVIDLKRLGYQTLKIQADIEILDDLEKQINNQRELIDFAQNELSRAVLKRKGLESLCEKRRIEYRKQKNKDEQKKMEDLYRSMSMVMKERES